MLNLQFCDPRDTHRRVDFSTTVCSILGNCLIRFRTTVIERRSQWVPVWYTEVRRSPFTLLLAPDELCEITKASVSKNRMTAFIGRQYFACSVSFGSGEAIHVGRFFLGGSGSWKSCNNSVTRIENLKL